MRNVRKLRHTIYTQRPDTVLKNKHLVLFFLAIVVLGWLLSRLRPWGNTPELRAALLDVDTATAEVLQVLAPGYPPWSLHKTEGGWTLLADNRPMPMIPRQAAVLLAAAAQVHSIRVLSTGRPDTLGLAPGQYIVLAWQLPGGVYQRLHIGREMEGGTWVKLPESHAVFLAAGHLRSQFALDARRFRSRQVIDWSVSALDSMTMAQGDTLIYRWHRQGADSVQLWLQGVLPFGEWPFADYFDETRGSELELARLTLYRGDEQALLHLYRWMPPNLPEDLHAVRGLGDALPAYVWHSSTNPLNYFSLSDTLRAQRLLNGPPPPARADTVQHEN